MSAAFGGMTGGGIPLGSVPMNNGSGIGSRLLELFGGPPSMTQALLGQYYDPQELQRRKIGGMISGIGQGLLSAQAGPGLTDAGVIGSAGLGMGQGLENAEQDYMREAVGGYELNKQQEREKREEDERLAERAEEADAKTKLKTFIENGPFDQRQKDYLYANPAAAAQAAKEIYFPEKVDPLKEMQIKKMQYEMDNPQGSDMPASIQEYEYSQKNPGFGKFIGDKKAVGKPTEADERAQLLAGQSQTQEKTVMDTFDSLADPRNSAGRMLPGGRAIMSAQGQQAQDSISNVIANWIYLVSGATATEQEVQRRTQEVMPTYWDDPQTKAQKKMRLKSYFSEMYERAGMGGGEQPVPQGEAGNPATAPIRRKFNPATGALE